MEQVYALGVTCIEFVQEWFRDYEGYFEAVNHLADPNHIVDIVFPLMSVIDSVFAAQLLLCMAFGGWLNSIMKWILLEHRPYWWVRETSYYSELSRPALRQTAQSCETGPGSPSGHSSTAAIVVMLCAMWAQHAARDRKIKQVWWWKYVVYSLYGTVIGSVLLSRMYIATHFPHQCIFGALVGSFLAPALCIYISDPYIWRCGAHAIYDPKTTLKWHVAAALSTVAISFLTYYSLVLSGVDPQSTVKLAFRWCASPDNIHVSTTPIFSLVQCSGNLLGWALSVTPAVAQYRHYTKNRSLIISALSTLAIIYSFNLIDSNICKSNAIRYYIIQFILSCLKPMLLLRLAPEIAMWPFKTKDKVE